ncbi:MAG: hypothetical protein NTZ09_16340 [Candidatus Hydrogenedentes bacterium]|nr:hypothetical protein [Candidatus Hydrogenedentota bacterium]
MPDASVELRVYCICGQKMKVTEDMFGLPAKCVACRRKIRIPARDDVAPDIHEIHLKDHPEFLRRPKKTKKSLALVNKPAGAEANVLDHAAVVPVCVAEHSGKIPELVRPLALDTLEPLQEIASLRNKVLRELRKAKEDGQEETDEVRANLKGHLHELDQARAYLDNEIRHKRVEVGAELAGVREKIVQTGLLARLEEINFTTYQSMTDRLRRQRDALERLYYDLGAWLDVRDPRAAGGYVSRPFEAIPEPGFEVHWPEMPQDSSPLLEQHTQVLREAFAAREGAKEKLEETARLRSEGSVSPGGVAEIRAEAKIEKRKAEAEITFTRKRLEEFGQDTAGDVQTIHACLDRARKRREDGALEPPAFEALEHELLRAQHDCAKAHDIVTRALIAGSSRDVPDTKGSYLERLAGVVTRPKQGPRIKLSAVLEYDNKGLGLDSWVAWAGALMLALAVFLPVVGKLSPVQACKTLAFQGGVYWIMAAPILGGAAIVAAGAIPRRRARGYLLLGLWLALTLLAVFILHESRYSAGAVAERFHKDAHWLMRPGVVLMVLANLTLLAASCTALCVQRRWWLVLSASAVIVVGISAVVLSNLMGLAVPMPTLTVDSKPVASPANPNSEVDVAVGNAGRRSLFLSPVQSAARNSFLFQVQRQSGSGWNDVAIQHVQLTGINAGPVDSRTPSHFRTLKIKPGAAADFKYSLPPGDYRVQLLNPSGPREPLVSLLSIMAPEPPPAPVSSLPAPVEQTVSAVEPPAPPLPAEVELKGVLIGPNREPRFSILLYVPGKSPETIDAMLGDKIHNDWIVSEFNPARQTLTVTKDTNILIVSRGRRLELP